MIRKWLGKGILGVGQRRGLFMPGEVCIVVYNHAEDRVICVQSMRGYSIFVRFKEKSEYAGLGLEALRAVALIADTKDLGLWRIFFRYKAQSVTKRKGALVQAVEGVEKRIEQKPAAPLPAAYIGEEYGDPVVETSAPEPGSAKPVDAESAAAKSVAAKPAVVKPAVELSNTSWAALSAKDAAAKDAGEEKHG